MNSREELAQEEQFAALLAECDDALAAGKTPQDLQLAETAPEIHPRLARDLACMQLLHRALRPANAAKDNLAGLPMAIGGLCADSPSRRLGRFDIRRELGRGGFGVVFLAYDPQLRREIALKVPRAEILITPDLRERFHREARAAAGLDHPNLVPVYEAGEIGPVCYIASAYCPGVNLAAWLKQRREAVPFRLAAMLLVQLADAVQHAHGRGVIHRDLKPGNVMLSTRSRSQTSETPVTAVDGPLTTDLVPKITDFGLAKLQQGVSALSDCLTRTGAIVGTLSYMAPEQSGSRQDAVGPAADVYGLGAILYELLTGRPPFKGETDFETLQQVQTTEPLAPSKLRLKVPPDLQTICLKCLHKERGRRYSSAGALGEDLQRYLAGKPILARPVSGAERTWRWCGRNHLSASLMVAVALLLVALAVGGMLAAIRQSTLTADAVTAHQDERVQRRRAEELLERQYVANAVRLMDGGDLAGSLPWIAEGIRLAGGDPQREAMHRFRLASVLQRYPRIEQAWFHDGGVRHAEFSRDGRYVVTASLDNTARVWEVATGKPVAPPLRHRGVVVQAAFSSDGRRVITSSADRTARIWDAADGKPVTPSLKHRGAVHCATFSPDGRLVVTASDDQTAQIWEATTGAVVGPPLKHNAGVVVVAFSPNGRHVVTASYDHTGRVWEAATGAPVGSPLKHQGDVQHAAFSPDGRYAVTCGQDATAQVWEALTGRSVGAPMKHSNSVNWAEFSPDSRLVVTASMDGTARVWEAATGEAVTAFLKHGGPVPGVTFSPDGRLVLAACLDGTARVWEVSSGNAAAPPLQHTGRLNSAAFSPDGRHVLTAADDDSARLWDLNCDRPALRHDDRVETASFSPDGRRIVTASCDRTARVWDLVTRAPVTPPLKHKGWVSSATFSPDGRRVVTASHDHTAQVWDAASGNRLTPPLQHEGIVVLAVFSPDGRLVATASHDATARVWDAFTGAPVSPPISHVWTSTVRNWVLSVAFSPDSRRIITASTNGSARVWDAATGAPVTPLLVHTNWVACGAFSPDGRRVVTASHDHTARMWDAITGEPLTPPLKHNSGVRWAAFNPQGDRLVTASADRTARIWDTGTGEPVTRPLQHSGDVFHAAFSPDGRRVLTATCTHGAARVWDAASGEPVTPPLLHPDSVWRAAFSPDGRRLVTPGGDGTARIWELPFDDRPAADLVRLAQVLAGVRISEPGEFAPMESTLYRTEWAALWEKYPHSFPASPPEQMRGWDWQAHYRRGRDLATQQLWQSAITEYSQALEHRPNDPRPWAGRAFAYLIVDKAHQAVSDYTKAIELTPEDPDLWVGRASAYWNLNDWHEVVADTTVAIDLDPTNPVAWTWRGKAHASLVSYEQAATDYTRAVELGSDSAWSWFQHACLLLENGDQEAYRQLCSRMLDRFGEGIEPYAILNLAQTCALSPAPGVDPARLVRLAEQALASFPKNSEYLNVLAMAHYRAGQFDEAVRRAREALEVNRQEDRWSKCTRARSWLILAMAQQCQGLPAEAKDWLDKSVHWLNGNAEAKLDPIDLYRWWSVRLEYQLQRREAQALIEGLPH